MPLDIIEQRKSRESQPRVTAPDADRRHGHLAAINAGCSSSAQPKAAAPAEVSVAEVICKQLGDSDEFTGRLEPVNSVEVRPRVFRLLRACISRKARLFVKATSCFRLIRDPSSGSRPPKRANFLKPKRSVRERKADFERAERLHNNDGMSAEEYTGRAAVRNEPKRNRVHRGGLRGAELNLDSRA